MKSGVVGRDGSCMGVCTYPSPGNKERQSKVKILVALTNHYLNQDFCCTLNIKVRSFLNPSLNNTDYRPEGIV